MLERLSLCVILFSILTFYSCRVKTDFDALKEFDRQIRTFDQIEYLNPFLLNRLKLTEGLDSLPNQIKLNINDMGLTLDQLIAFRESMNEIGVSTYVKGAEFSIYITHGSFARYYGYLLSYSETIGKGGRYLTERNEWNVGNEAYPNIYHVWTD